MSLPALTHDTHQAPRAPSLFRGVTSPEATSRSPRWALPHRHCSYGLMCQSQILRSALLPLCLAVSAGCCQPLLEVGPSQRYLCNPCVGARTRTPWRPAGALSRLLPSKHRTHPSGNEFVAPDGPCGSFCRERYFGAAVIHSCSGSHTRLAPRLLPPRSLKGLRAAGPYTPRSTRLVTCPEQWHRYMSESGN